MRITLTLFSFSGEWYYQDMLGLYLLIIVALIVLLPFIIKRMTTFFGRRITSAINQRHSDAELILHTGIVPRKWYDQSLAQARRRRHMKDDEVRSRVQRLCLRRLESLMRYFSSAQVYENESVKRTLLENLEKTRNAWASGRWAGIVEKITEGPANASRIGVGGLQSSE